MNLKFNKRGGGLNQRGGEGAEINRQNENIYFDL